MAALVAGSGEKAKEQKLSGDLMAVAGGNYTLDATSAPERAALRRGEGKQPWTAENGLFGVLEATWLPRVNGRSPGFKYSGSDEEVTEALLDSAWNSLAAVCEGARAASGEDNFKHSATADSCAEAFVAWDSGEVRSFYPARDNTAATIGSRVKKEKVSKAASGRRRSKKKASAKNA